MKYLIITLSVLSLLVACDLFNEGFGDKVDLEGPSVSVSDQNDYYINGILKLSGTATDDDEVKSVIVQFTSNVTGSPHSLSANISGTSWTLDVNTTDKAIFKDGAVDFKIIVTDSADKTSEQLRSFYIDNTIPTVLITNPDSYNDDKSYNETIQIKGSIHDIAVKTVVVTLKGNGQTHTGSIVQLNPFIAEFDYSSLGMLEGAYELSVVATDIAGNSNTYFYHVADTRIAGRVYDIEALADPINSSTVETIRKDGSSSAKSILLNIDPNSDFPKLTIINEQEWEGNGVTNNFAPESDVTLSANISDDDGIQEIRIKIFEKRDYDPLSEDNSAALLRNRVYRVNSGLLLSKTIGVSLKNNSWGDWDVVGVDRTPSSDAFVVEIEIIDINGKSTSSRDRNHPDYIDYKYIYAIGDKKPLLSNVVVPKYANREITVTGYAKGTNSAPGSIEYDINSIKVKISSPKSREDEADAIVDIIEELDPVNEKEKTFSITIPKAKLDSIIGSTRFDDYDMEIVVENEIGKTDTVKRVLLYDNKAPESLNIELPASSSINGKVVLRGSAEDNSGRIVDSNLYINKVSPTLWDYKIPVGKYSWEYTFDTGVRPYNGSVNLTLEVKDVAGNISSFNRSILVEQSTDIPEIKYGSDWNPVATFNMVDPKESVKDNHVKSGFLQGFITDDDDVDKESIKIWIGDKNGNAVSGFSGTVSSPLYQAVSNSPSVNSNRVDWSHDVSGLNEGIYQYRLTASDYSPSKLGDPVKTVYSATTFFSIDKGAPTLTVNSDLTGLFSAGVNVELEIIDGNGVKEVKSSLLNRTITSVTDTYILPYTDGDLVEGLNGESITVTDYYGRTKTYSYEFRYDKQPPTVDIGLVNNLVLNGEVSFPVYANDANGISEVTLKTSLSDINIPLTRGINWSPTNPIDLTSPGILNESVNILSPTDTSDISTIVSNKATPLSVLDGEAGKYYMLDSDRGKVYYFNGVEYIKEDNIYRLDIYAKAIDNAGKVGLKDSNGIDSKKTILIGEASDKPVIKVTGLQKPVGAPSYFPGQIVSFNVTDDDGVDATSFEIAIIPNSGDPNEEPGSSDWLASSSNYRIPNTVVSGNKKLWIRAKDINGLSHRLTTPIEFTIDRESPKINSITVEDNDGKAGYVNIGSINIVATLDVTDDTLLKASPVLLSFTDKNGLMKEDVIFTNSSGDIYRSAPINKDILGNGTTELTFTVTDQFGKESSEKVSIFKDVTKPALVDSRQLPVTNSVANGSIVLTGDVTDEPLSENSGVDRVELKFSENSDTATNTIEAIYSPGANSWSKNIDLLDSTFILNNGKKIINLDNIPGVDISGINLVTYETPVTGKYYKADDSKYYLYNGAEYLEIIDIWTLPVEITAYDKAGNSSVTVNRTIVIDPKTDIPVLSFDNNIKDSGHMTFPGQIIKGTVSDDDGVDKDSLKVAITDRGVAPVSADWISISLPYSSKTQKWTYEIPASISNTIDGKFGERDLHIKAGDVNSTPTEWSRVLPFVIDRTPPEIVSFTAKDNSGKSYVNGDSTSLILSADITDDSRLDSSEIKVTLGSTPILLSHDSGNRYSATLDESSSSQIKLSTIDDGTLTLTLVAKDQFGKQSLETITVLKDVVAPINTFTSPINVSDFSSPVDVREVNGKVLISGTTSDPNMSKIELSYGSDVKATLTKAVLASSSTENFETGSTLGSWSYILDTRDVVATGDKIVSIKASDLNENISENVITLKIDQSKDNPSIIEVSSHKYTDPPALDKFILGSGNDNNVIFGVTTGTALDRTKLQIEIDGVDRSPIILSSDSKHISWYQDLSDLGDGAVVTVVCKYTGAGTVDHKYGLRGAIETSGHTVQEFSANDKLSGYILDDDIVDANSVNVKINNSDNIQTGVDSKRLRFEHDFTVETDGIYSVIVTANDFKEPGYETDIKTATFNTLIVRDSSAPEILAKLKDKDGIDLAESGAYYVRNDVSTYGTATDDLSIKDFKITVVASSSDKQVVQVAADPSATTAFDVLESEFGAVADDNKVWEWDFSLERLPDAYSDRVVTLVYEAVDAVGNSVKKEHTVTVDREAPTITPAYPLAGDVVNGDVLFRGSADDASLKQIDIAIGLYKDSQGENIPESDWNSSKTISGTYNWNSDITNIETFANGTYAYPHEETPGNPEFVIGNTRDYIDKASLQLEIATLKTWVSDRAIYKLKDRDVYYRVVDKGHGRELEGYEPLWDLYILLRAIDKADNVTYLKHKIIIDAAGDRPTVSISTPKEGDQLGGSINVMGTARDDDAIHKVYMRIDANSDGVFENIPLIGSLNGQYFDEREVHVLADRYNWSMEINADGKLYPDASDRAGYGTVTLEVWAEDTKDNFNPGVKSRKSTVKFEMDNTVPIIENVQFNSIPYLGGQYQKGIIPISALVKDPTLGGGVNDKISSISVSTDGVYWTDVTKQNTTPIELKSGLVDYGLTSELEPGFDKYKFTWNYDTSGDANNSPKTLGIRVFDGKYYSMKYLNFNVDNLPPDMQDDGVNGPYINGWNIVESDKDDISGPEFWLKGSSSDAAGLDRVDIYFVRGTNICKVDSAASTWSWETLGTPTISNLESKSSYAISINDKNEFYNDSTSGDGDLFKEAISDTLGDVTWGVKFPAEKIVNDGPIDVYYIAYDKSGNATMAKTSGVVSNFKPVVNSINIGYDLDPGVTVNRRLYPYTYENSVYPQVIGKMAVEINASISPTKTSAIPAVTITEVGIFHESDLELNTPLIPISNSGRLTGDIPFSTSGNNTYIVKVTDSDGTVTKKKINAKRMGSDNISPEVSIYPFKESYYIDSQGNILGSAISGAIEKSSLDDDGLVLGTYKRELKNGIMQNVNYGHIELATESTIAKVSGIVKLSGYIYENSAVKNLDLQIAGTSIGALTNDKFGIKTNMDVSKLRLYYIENTVEREGIKFDKDGTSFFWEYEWDSSIASNTTEIAVVATDFADNSNSIAVNSYSSGVKSVDVVPYISYVDTELARINRDVPSVFNRTALGKYPVRAGSEVTIHGYNLKGTTNKVEIGTREIPTTSYTMDKIVFTVPDATESGMFKLTVDGTTAINNSNDNQKAYNRTPNRRNNNLLTDDIEFDVYGFVDAAVPEDGNIEKPHMEVSPLGKIGFSFRNSNFYFSMPGVPNNKTINQPNTWSHHPFSKSWEGFNETTFTWDAMGNAYGLATSGDTGSTTNSAVNMSLFTRKAGTRVSSLDLWNAYRNIGSNKNRIEHMSVMLDGATSYFFNRNRFQSMNMVTTMPNQDAASSDSNKTNMYIVYYDDTTKQVRYRYGTIGRNGHDGIGSTLPEIGSRGSQNTSPVDAAHENVQVVASSGTSRSSNARYNATPNVGAGKYASIGVHRNALGSNRDVVIISWFEASSRKLYISYNDDPRNLDSASSRNQWQTNAVVVDSYESGGFDVDMEVDSDGGIHLAYYSTTNGDLKYAYISRYNDFANINIARVDSYQSVGTKCSIDVAKVGSNQIPFISYYMQSNGGGIGSTKVAHRVNFNSFNPTDFNGADSNNYFTGNWEVTVIPTQNTPINDNVSVGVWSDKSDGTLKAIEKVNSGDNTYARPDGNNGTHSVGKSAMIGGNGTSNPVISYACESGILEMAQKQ